MLVPAHRVLVYKPSAAAAAKKAFLVTRIGDIMFMLGISSCSSASGPWTSHDIFDNTDAFPAAHELLTLGTFFIFGGAIGKSRPVPAA